MPSQKNIQLLEEAKGKLAKANAVFFVNYQGITHKQLEEARNIMRDVDGEIAVVKNNLMNIALNEKKVDAKESLQGTLAAFFSYGDPSRVAGAMYQFFKKNLGPEKIKFGVFEGAFIDDKMVITLGTLPPKEVLIAKVVGLMKSPLTNLVYALNYNTSKLVFTLKEIEKKKQATS